MKILLMVTAALMISTNAFAGILLEPYVGYETGTYKGDVGGIAAFKISGTQFGAKVGYSVLGLGFGADVAKVSLKAKDTTTASQDLDLAGTDLGVFVQFQFPILFKVSATYFVSSKLTSDNNGSKIDFDGKGFKVGAGFTGLPFVAINLDLISEKYDDIKSSGVTIADAHLDRASVMLSISAPFNF